MIELAPGSRPTASRWCFRPWLRGVHAPRWGGCRPAATAPPSRRERASSSAISGWPRARCGSRPRHSLPATPSCKVPCAAGLTEFPSTISRTVTCAHGIRSSALGPSARMPRPPSRRIRSRAPPTAPWAGRAPRRCGRGCPTQTRATPPSDWPLAGAVTRRPPGLHAVDRLYCSSQHGSRPSHGRSIRRARADGRDERGCDDLLRGLCGR